MPENGLGEIAGAAVVEEEAVVRHSLRQADPPERRRAPLVTVRPALVSIIGEAVTHVVQQEVGIRPDQLEALGRILCIARRDELGRVTGNAAALIEGLLAA